MKINKFMRYQGSKDHFVPEFNKLYEKTNKNIFCELFLGSGAIFINCQDSFDEYILNDNNENIMSIWNAVIKFTYNDFMNVKKFIFDKFGDIKTNKEAYYKFRNWYNENIHFSGKTEKGICLYYLANSCINSMLRFGPNGMNQSYGNRLFIFQRMNLIILKINY